MESGVELKPLLKIGHTRISFIREEFIGKG